MKNIILGMPSLIEINTLSKQVALCRELGLQFIELNMDLPFCSYEVLAAEEVRSISEKTGILFTLHLPENLNLCTFYSPLRKANFDLFIKTIHWADRAGITLLNMHIHPGVYFTLPHKKEWIFQKNQELFLHHLKKAFKRILPFAVKKSISISIENGMFYLPFIEQAVNELITYDGICLTWDTGHDATSGFKDKPVLMRYKNKIKHIHLHDYKGNANHQELYSGDLDINEVLEIARQNHAKVVVEVKTAGALRPSINKLREKNIT